MSEERPQIDPAAIQGGAPDLRLPAGGEEGIQPVPGQSAVVTATRPAARAGDPVGPDGVAPALLVALLQEYAVHQGPIAEAQRKLREFHIQGLLMVGGGGVVFVACATWMLIAFAVGATPTRQGPPPWLVGMIVSGTIALSMGWFWWLMFIQERRKSAAGEKGKADVIRRLLAAFPQLRGADAEALLSGKATQAIVGGPQTRRGSTAVRQPEERATRP
jgi:hypothetical protein